MSPTDAVVVTGDWISEHYLTTDATKESFKARVLLRRKEWDASETDSLRSRFTRDRTDLLARIARLDGTPDRALRDDLVNLLGFNALGLQHKTSGPVTTVTQAGLPDVAGTAIVTAHPVEQVDDLLAKDRDTLAEPYVTEDGDRLTSVARLLSSLFVDADGPAFALVLAGRTLMVAERERWAEGRSLAVDLQLVAERNDVTRGGEVDRALAMLGAEALAPDAEGTIWWHDVLEESVKHTVGVSQDLREGVRLSIELIANEVVDRRRAEGLEPLPQAEAQPLAKQALRYLYRILFLLYAEASPELGVLPVGAAEYEQGYSLDRLRELVQVPLTTPQSQDGTHLYDSLAVLFGLVDSGTKHFSQTEDGLAEPLTFRSLRADLFRAEAVGHIAAAGLGNQRLQEVLQHLLLSKVSKGRDRGFISYAELGINQLGAVYEGLMSYTGRFAETDLFEVAKNGDSSKGSWLVPVDRSEGIDADDFVRAEDPVTGEVRPVLHHEGSFVFRLAGRERQQSASYYTPEVLTRFTVGQALEELLDQDGHKTTAEEVLSLTICEPALGSGAFAIEAVRQLAAEYLVRRQEETQERVDPEEYPRELQKVKAYLALHNVHGVDLNATAVELAEISLWLDTMVEGLHAPWFGLHLKRGNSLVGARRAGFTRAELQARSWLTTVPTDVLSHRDRGVSRRTDLIHHFLVPAQGWGAAAEIGKDVKDLVPDAVKTLKAWRRSVRKKPTQQQLDLLRQLSQRVETLWDIASRRLEVAEQQVRRDIPLWGRDAPEAADAYVTRKQIEDSLSDPDGAYRRLTLVMNAWCALWFWPLTETKHPPPSTGEWLQALTDVLGRDTLTAAQRRRGDSTIADVSTWGELGIAEENDRILAGALPSSEVMDKHPWLETTEAVADQQGFFHWHLDFAGVFGARGGFDLQVGNPPWVRPTTNSEALLAEADPWWQLKGRVTQEEVAQRREATLALPGIQELLVAGTIDVVSLAEFVGDGNLFPHLRGLQPDLYRCLVERSWSHRSGRGVATFIHPESHFTDEKAGALRSGCYARLRRHWQFINELTLFEIDHHVSFGVHVYGAERTPSFLMATSLYHPDTVARSLVHDGSGDEPGLKDPEGRWDVRPHRDRILHVDEEMLRTWHALLEPADVPTHHARMVYTVNRASAAVLEKLAEAPRLGSLGLQFSAGWHEKNDRTKGFFDSGWGRPNGWRDVILQGPHFHVGNPFYKQPNETMANNLDWSPVDLETLPADAVPVTSYKPTTDTARYDASYTKWEKDGDLVPARDYYRVAWRAMAANTGERTLISAVIPPGAAHPNGVFCVGGPTISISDLLLVAGAAQSLLNDYLVRAVPKSGIYQGVFNRLVSVNGRLSDAIRLRVIRLQALTDAYSELSTCLPSARWSDWTGGLNYPARQPLFHVSGSWSPSIPLRRAVDRRQAQLETDALVALSLGVSAEELCTIYRTQFAVLYGYDRNVYFYDSNGRLVPNSVLTVWRKKGDHITPDERTATNASGNTYTYELPFVTLDREADMRQAYAHFEALLGEGNT